MKRRIILTLILIIIVSTAIHAIEFGDVLLSIPAVVKSVAPLVYVPEMLSDPSALPLGLAAIGLYTVPNVILLANVYTGNIKGTKLWRTITTFADAAATLGFIGIGTYTMLVDQDIGGWGTIISFLFFFMALPAGAAFGLDFIPYPLERKTK